jgi:hypothetical protein
MESPHADEMCDWHSLSRRFGHPFVCCNNWHNLAANMECCAGCDWEGCWCKSYFRDLYVYVSFVLLTLFGPEYLNYLN